jgi:lipopolysaccharide/colanic/teichoic acid biosynthesis glycosyltransferase
VPPLYFNGLVIPRFRSVKLTDNLDREEPMLIWARLTAKDPGPVLDRETTIGRGGRRFQMLKFRTTARGPQQRAAPWAQYPTRVGLFLEQTRIEHLPQLINVLRAEMRLADSYLFD